MPTLPGRMEVPPPMPSAEMPGAIPGATPSLSPEDNLADKLEPLTTANPHEALGELSGVPNLPPIEPPPVDTALPSMPEVKPADIKDDVPTIETNGNSVAGLPPVETGTPLEGPREVSDPTTPAGKISPETQPLQGATPTIENAVPAGQPDTSTPEATQEAGNNKGTNQENQGTASGNGENKATEEANKPSDVNEQRILEEKVKNGTATESELKKHRENKQKENATKRKEELNQKMIDGNFTDAELAEWQKLNKDEKAKGKNKPETETERVNRELNEIGGKIIKDLAEGKELNEEDMEKLTKLREQNSGLNKGLTMEQAKLIAQKAFNPEMNRKAKKELAIQKEVREKLQELMALEAQMLSIPQNLEALKLRREEVKQRIQSKDLEVKAFTDPEQQAKKRLEIYPLYMQASNIKAEMVRVKNTAPILQAQYKDTMQYVRRKLGITGFGQALGEWLDAKISTTFTDINLDVQSLSDID